MVDISIVTSLYQSEKFLPIYINHVLKVAQSLADYGISFEVVIVANDASKREHALIDDLVTHAKTFQIIPIYVDRETVYASWNRGIEASKGEIIGFWNADDIRMAEAIVEAHKVLNTQENKLIYFSYAIVRFVQIWKQYRIAWKRLHPALAFNKSLFSRKMKAGPFFMFKRELYNLTGSFDPRFRIAGDLEWCIRAMQFTDFIPGKEIVGELVIHGSNLSGVQHPLENVEKNMIYLMHGMQDVVMPSDPKLMLETWASWKVERISLSRELEDKLFGKNAMGDWQKWQDEQQKILKRQRFSDTIRFIPRQIINKTGLRFLLIRLGVRRSPTGRAG
jgi:hypothetical protein